MKNKISILSITGLFLSALGMLFIQTAHANPSAVASGCTVQTAAATSTVSYLFATTTIANGTTTLPYDSYCNGSTQLTDKAALTMYLTGSSTLSTIDIYIEYATGYGSTVNCATSQSSCDWFQDRLDSMVATTTTPIALTPAASFSWRFASTSNQAGPTVTNLTYESKIMMLYTPTRYFRVVFAPRAGNPSTSAAIWAQITPVKERAQ